MSKIMVSCYDIKADSYSIPFSVNTKDEARRSFGDALKDKNTLLGQHPADFILVGVGLFDEQSGVFTVTEHERIALGSDYVSGLASVMVADAE